MRRPTGHLDWQPTETGWRLGRYAVVFLGPKRWALQVDGTTRSIHARASEAAAAAQLAERGRRRWMRLLRNGVVVAAGAAVLVIAQAGRFVPNPGYQAARDAVAVLESAHRSVVSGRASVMSFTGEDGIIGGEFTAAPPINLGGDVQPRAYAVLMTLHGGDCYVIRWSPESTREYDIVTALLTPQLPCEVGPTLLQQGLFARSWFQSTDGHPFDWKNVLPPPRFQVSWFIPVVIAALLLILQGAIGISLALIAPARSTLPPTVPANDGGRPRDLADPTRAPPPE